MWALGRVKPAGLYLTSKTETFSNLHRGRRGGCGPIRRDKRDIGVVRLWTLNLQEENKVGVSGEGKENSNNKN